MDEGIRCPFYRILFVVIHAFAQTVSKALLSKKEQREHFPHYSCKRHLIKLARRQGMRRTFISMLWQLKLPFALSIFVSILLICIKAIAIIQRIEESIFRLNYS